LLVSSYAYIGYASYEQKFSHKNTFFCPFKKISGIPCPSCGTTRSVLFFLKGEPIQALKINPLGMLSMLIIFLTPFWITFDFLTKRESLITGYLRVEQLLRNRYMYIPLIFLGLINWIWGISKGL
jgi:hypothetical protein